MWRECFARENARVARISEGSYRAPCPQILSTSYYEIISQISQEDNSASHLHEAQIILRPPLVAHHQPAQVPELGEKPLDLLVAFVASEIAPVLGLGFLLFMRCSASIFMLRY
jgi:hypothetical protein